MRSGLALLVLTTGCSAAFGLAHVTDDTDAGTGAGIDRCTASPADPLRYAVVASPDPTQPWSWDAARLACQQRGLDLAVLNDVHELAVAPTEQWPFWVGARSDGHAWTAVDGCTPFASAPATVAGCGAVTDPSTTAALDCATAPMTAALCETPRAETAACVAAQTFDPAAVEYVVGAAPESRADAAATCRALGGTLAVIDSLAELHEVARRATDGHWPALWFGAQFVAPTWQSDTGCHALFSWADGAPASSAPCVASAWRTAADGSGERVFAGMEAVACDAAQTYALCELPVTPPR